MCRNLHHLTLFYLFEPANETNQRNTIRVCESEETNCEREGGGIRCVVENVVYPHKTMTNPRNQVQPSRNKKIKKNF